MIYKKAISSILRVFLEAFFPVKCFVCGSWIDVKDGFSSFSQKTLQWEKGEMPNSFFICESCLNNFIPVKPPFCLKCGIMFQSDAAENHICGRCLKNLGKFRSARSFGVYDQALMKAIHSLKYKGKIQLARPLGMILFLTFMNFFKVEQVDMIFPVPLHGKRLRQRGFNQALLLIRHWPQNARQLKINSLHFKIEKDLLIRNRWTEPQTGLGRELRAANIKGAFTLKKKSLIKGKNILLVDDVYTTGATVRECSKVLLNGGAASVDVLTLAQTVQL